MKPSLAWSKNVDELNNQNLINAHASSKRGNSYHSSHKTVTSQSGMRPEHATAVDIPCPWTEKSIIQASPRRGPHIDHQGQRDNHPEQRPDLLLHARLKNSMNSMTFLLHECQGVAGV